MNRKYYNVTHAEEDEKRILALYGARLLGFVPCG